MMKRLAAAASAAALAAAPAIAHPGHEQGGLAGGILHPLTGADHLVAMVLVGLWAGMMAGRARIVLPSAFLSAMLAGFAFGALSHAAAGGTVAEVLIVASLVALGGAVTLRLRGMLGISAALVALFGFAHGMAHGVEAPAGALAGFAGGFMIATALLHAFGLYLAKRIPTKLQRWVGAVGAGAALVIAGAS